MKDNPSSKFMPRYVKDEDVRQIGWKRISTGATWLPWTKNGYNAIKIRVGRQHAWWFGFKYEKESK